MESDTNFRLTFLDEINMKIAFANFCYERLYNWSVYFTYGITQPPYGVTDREDQKLAVFECISSFLSHVNGIAAALFPVPAKRRRSGGLDDFKERRGEMLRSLLEVGPDHMLKDNRFRNHLTHIDERIDKWWIETKGKRFSRLNIMPWRSQTSHMLGVFAADSFENYDQTTMTLYFSGDPYEIIPIIVEIRRIGHKAKDLTVELSSKP